jgi:lysosomal acid lipase/cholesteryl ester hydrolase
LPFQLFDRGFDIYLASNRGTKYCQEHTSLSIKEKEYWAWSWAEMGIYDDVANVKMIKERTGKKVSYVGVS